MQLPRHAWWRLNYRNDRYMQYVSSDALAQRFKDILVNQQTLSHQGQLGIVSPADGGALWMEMFTHLLEEYNYRGGIPSTLDIPLVNTTYPEEPKAVTILKKLHIPKNGKFLLKLGKSVHLKEMFENGRILLKPASYYADPSLNRAQKDDELNFTIELHPKRVHISESLQKSNINAVGNIKLNLRSSNDFYVYCMSTSQAIRLFDDFEADSCIFIYKPEEFCRHLIDSCKKQFQPDLQWRGFAFPVRYVDPLNPPTLDLDIYFTKHFRYWYQQEYRIVWLSRQPVERLSSIFVNVGDIKPYSKFITL